MLPHSSPHSGLVSREGPAQLRRVRYRRGHRLFCVLALEGYVLAWVWRESGHPAPVGGSSLSLLLLCDTAPPGAWRRCASDWTRRPATSAFGPPHTGEAGSDCLPRPPVLWSSFSSRTS